MKAFIFDMDGLMFDTERVFVSAWDYVGEKMGLGKAGYMCIRTLGMNTPACEQAWRDEFGDEVDLDALWRYSREFVEDYYRKNAVSVKPGLYELLTYLKNKGYKLAVASSTKRYQVERHLNSANVRQYFDAVIWWRNPSLNRISTSRQRRPWALCRRIAVRWRTAATACSLPMQRACRPSWCRISGSRMTR